MNRTIDSLEARRLALQTDLDARKTQSERNRLGQFSTPSALAEDILRYAANLVADDVRFLDPAVGTGAFFSALARMISRDRITEARGFEIDAHYGEPASRLWSPCGFTVELADFTHAEPSGRFNLVVCNPPYVRHHHLRNDEKTRLRFRTNAASGMKLDGLAGLYCHFLGLAHAWMAEGGIAGWLIPSEFMDVNYGKAVKRYLLEKVTLLHIHRFDPNDVQFADALVSSAVVWFRKSPPPPGHAVRFTFGGTLGSPRMTRDVPVSVLATELKWTRFPLAETSVGTGSGPVLADFFRIKRGIATGDNEFFILDENEIAARDLPPEVFRPILPSPRYITENEIHGNPRPILDRRLFLLDTRLPENEIAERYPTLFAYLEEGKAREIHQRYLCRHRTPWYAQEDRPPAPLLCTYLGRGDAKTGRPFRFILNHSTATVANVYLAMYPTPVLARAMESDPGLIRRVWEILNHIPTDRLLGEGRVYGGGLHKLEPKELANVDAAPIAKLIPNFATKPNVDQLRLFDDSVAVETSSRKRVARR